MKNVKWVVVLIVVGLLVLSVIESSTIAIIGKHAVGWAFLTGAIFQTIYLILQGELKC